MLLLNAAEYQKRLVADKARSEGLTVVTRDYFLDARIRQSLNAKNTLTLRFPWGEQCMHKLEN